MYIDSISLVTVFCIVSQCVLLILVISIRWFQNILIDFQDLFDDMQSFPTYVSLISNQVVPMILVFLTVFSTCLNRFAIYTSMICNDSPPVFLWFSFNLDDFLMFHPKTLVFLIGCSKRLSRISTWISLICIDFPKKISDLCFIFVLFPPPLVEKCAHARFGFAYFCLPKRWFIRKFPYMEPI